MTDYDKLFDRDIDVFVATGLMDWRWIKLRSLSRPILMPKSGVVGSSWGAFIDGYADKNTIPVTTPEEFPDNPPKSLPYYSTDDNAARLVRDRIAELGLIAEYRGYLATLIWPANTPASQFKGPDEFAFSFEQATPRQQCVAALRAVEGATK